MLLVFTIVEAIALVICIVLIVIKTMSMRRILAVTRELSAKNVEVDDCKAVLDPQSIELASDINTIKSNLLAFIESTKSNVITLTDAIEQLSEATKANVDAAQETTDSVIMVSEKAQEQLGLVRDNLSMIEATNDELTNIDDYMNRVRSIISESLESCEEGVKTLVEYEEGMNSVKKRLNDSVNELFEFNNQIKEVNTIGEIVVELSEELKLLALNASIEAARAGEAGRGFAVVSEEMSVLSEKTKENMASINEILQKVTSSSKYVNDSISKCDRQFEDSSELFVKVSDSFRTISSQSNDINCKIEDVATRYNSIASNSNVSKEKADSVFSASEAIKDRTGSIVSISEKTSMQSAKMNGNVDSLEQMLKGIRNLIKQFKTGIAPSENNRSTRVKIAFFSKLDNYFWYSIRRGVFYAQRELKNNNVDIVYFPYKDDIEECNFPNDVNKCIEEGFDAIIFPGFMNKADRELVNAVNKGIEVFTYNCDCNNSIKRISCYEPDQEEAGIMAAKAIGKCLNKSGNVAIVAGDRSMSVNSIRYNAFVDYVSKNYKDIKIISTIDVTYDPEKTYKQVTKLIMDNPTINAIYSTTGMQIELAKAIVDTGYSGKIKAVVFDHNDDIFKFINKGIIAAAIDHDPFSQGHDSIIYMYNHIVDGMVLPEDRIKCKAGIVDGDNIAERICAN